MLLFELARKQIKEFATDQGFHSVGFTSAHDAQRFPEFCDWLDRGFAASMGYLEKRKDSYRNPQGVLPNCRTLVLLTLPYQGHAWTRSVTKRARHREISSQSHATVGSYANAAEDYHLWIRRRLKPLVRELQAMFPDCHTRSVVDTAPLLERHFASQAGLGWVGKNTMLLNRQIGSYFFLCAILTQADLLKGAESDRDESTGIEPQGLSSSHCGTCTACLDACPTKAFVSPYVLDANRCISYWTIEHRGEIPESMRHSIGPWLFGCDVCQIVCPWNHKAQAKVPDPIGPGSIEQKSDCLHWLSLDQPTFDSLYKKTPFWRTGLHGMQRNAMIVAANLGIQSAIPQIREFTKHSDEHLRELAQWAIGQLSAEGNLS